MDSSAPDTPAVRPPRTRRTPRTRRVELRLSEEEYAALEAKATQAGLTLSALLRNHIGKVQVHDQETERRRVVLLNRIHANLQLIATWVQTHKAGVDVVQVLAHLVALEREITRHIAMEEEA